MFIPIILALLINPVDLAGKYIYESKFQEASEILKEYNPSPANYNNYHYYSLISHFRLNNKEKVIKDLVNIENSFYPFSRRQTALISLIKYDIRNWKENDLADIQRDMIKSQDKLSSLNPGNDTQKIQKQIIAKLDKFIEEASNPPKIKNGIGKEDSNKFGKSSGNSNKPALDSQLMDGIGKGLIIEKKLKQYTENWGSLPPEERAKVTKELTRDIPPQYKELVDQYLKSLNKGVK